MIGTCVCGKIKVMQPYRNQHHVLWSCGSVVCQQTIQERKARQDEQQRARVTHIEVRSLTHIFKFK